MVGWNSLHSNDIKILVRVVQPVSYDGVSVGHTGIALLEVVWREAWTRTWHKVYWVELEGLRGQYLFYPKELIFIN